MPNATTNMGLTKPLASELADISVINANMDKVDGHRHLGGADGLAVRAVQSGTLAARPAAGTAGQVYFATDTAQLFLDNGSAWVDPAASAGFGGINTLATELAALY